MQHLNVTSLKMTHVMSFLGSGRGLFFQLLLVAGAKGQDRLTQEHMYF